MLKVLRSNQSKIYLKKNTGKINLFPNFIEIKIGNRLIFPVFFSRN